MGNVTAMRAIEEQEGATGGLEMGARAFAELKEVKPTLAGRGKKIRENRVRLI
ncbi:MAG: hypothetical protein ACP5E9_10595 [Candidatus Methanospirareceae archaeon]